MFLTEFTSPYSLNTQRGWHTSKKVSLAYVLRISHNVTELLAPLSVWMMMITMMMMMLMTAGCS